MTHVLNKQAQNKSTMNLRLRERHKLKMCECVFKLKGTDFISSTISESLFTAVCQAAPINSSQHFAYQAIT